MAGRIGAACGREWIETCSLRGIPVETMVVNEETFGGRLRRERERRQIALSSISANTKISASFFEALERNDLSRWPTGIFRRAFIRAYAAGIGLDPDTIAKEFHERFPDPAELTPMAAGEAPAATPPAPPGSSPRTDTVLRLTLADAGAPFVRGRLLADMRSRCAAVAMRRRDDAGGRTRHVSRASGRSGCPWGCSPYSTSSAVF